MRTIIGMDPGKHRTALSVFIDRKLHRLHYTAEYSTPLACGVAAGLWLRQYFGGSTRLVQEGQQVYGEFEGKDPNDLLPLAYVNGVVAAMAGDATEVPEPVLPREWKGGIPGKKPGKPYALIPRVETRLDKDEMEVLLTYLNSIPADLQHNVWDACGIGLHGCGRGFTGSMRKRVIAR